MRIFGRVFTGSWFLLIFLLLVGIASWISFVGAIIYFIFRSEKEGSGTVKKEVEKDNERNEGN